MARTARDGAGAVTIALRPLVHADAPWLDGWLAPVAASVGYGGGRSTKSTKGTKGTNGEGVGAGGGVRAKVIVRDGSDAGIAVYRLGAPKQGSAIIEIIATPAAFARTGSEMMAAALIEEELRVDRVRSVYAPAPAVHGIAVYFWIRLGYRPLLRAEWPCEREGVAWLVREL